MVEPDGRRARSDQTRRLLLEATLAILERDGPAGVTYRAVAREAGTAANAVSYHFGSIDGLLVATLEEHAREMAAVISALRPDHFAEDLAAVLVGAAATQKARLIAEFELYLLAGRRPQLRPAVQAWAAMMVAPFPDLTPAEAAAVHAAVDGMCVQLLIDENTDVALMASVIDAALPERHRALSCPPRASARTPARTRSRPPGSP